MLKKELEIILSNQASKFFEKHRDIENKFCEKLKQFYSGVKSVDICCIQGSNPKQYRIRIGKYRVIFFQSGETIVAYHIFVLKADSRGDIYKK